MIVHDLFGASFMFMVASVGILLLVALLYQLIQQIFSYLSSYVVSSSTHFDSGDGGDSPCPFLALTRATTASDGDRPVSRCRSLSARSGRVTQWEGDERVKYSS